MKEKNTNKILDIQKSGRIMAFRSSLIVWYNDFGRSLPWRETKDPYKIWISEIILQQTQVKQGWDYYKRFIEKFPTVQELYKAKEDEVLKLWEGLGYYNRAHNMMVAAKQICEDFNGKFPNNYNDLIKLKGVGPYTASAIASIAFGEPKAVLDGNVFRVLSRIESCEVPIDTTKGKKFFMELADEFLDKEDPGTYNQAIMDFGAIQCKVNNPECLFCPVRGICKALLEGTTELLPVKEKKVKVKEQTIHYVLLQQPNSNILVKRRDKKGIWKGLYELPSLEIKDHEPFLEEKKLFNIARKTVGGRGVTATLNHSIDNARYKLWQTVHLLSHRRLYIYVHHVVLNKNLVVKEPYIEISPSDHQNYAFPKPLRQFLDKQYKS